MRKLRNLTALILAISIIFTVAISASAQERMVAISDAGVSAEVRNGEMICDLYVYTYSSSYTVQMEIGIYMEGQLIDFLYLEDSWKIAETFAYPIQSGYRYCFDINVWVMNSSGRQVDDLHLVSNVVSY